MIKNSKATRILVAEDEPSIRRVLAVTLQHAGYDVDLAANGAEAETFIAVRPYDLMLVDIKMPVMNGMELYERVHAEYPALARRIVFTTGDVINKQVEHFIESTDRPYISKPFSADELIEVVKANLKKPVKH
jgi:CheY-like chemotaxis protein